MSRVKVVGIVATASPDAGIGSDLAAVFADPVRFCRVVLGLDLWPVQEGDQLSDARQVGRTRMRREGTGMIEGGEGLVTHATRNRIAAGLWLLGWVLFWWPVWGRWLFPSVVLAQCPAPFEDYYSCHMEWLSIALLAVVFAFMCMAGLFMATMLLIVLPAVFVHALWTGRGGLVPGDHDLPQT